MLLCFCIGASAQSFSIGDIVVDLGTFTGISAAVAMGVVQIVKYIPGIGAKKLYKCLAAVVVGIVVCYVAWALDISEYLKGMTGAQVLIQGGLTAAGAMGLYDLIVSVYESILALIRSAKQ